MKSILQTMAMAVLLAACSNEAETPVVTNNEKTTEKVEVKVADKPAPATPSPASEERNRKIAMRFYEEVINKHNVEALSDYCAPNYLEHQYDTHFDSDLSGVKKAFADYFTAFPDMHVKVNFMVVEGDMITAQITTTGTNTGPIYGQKPTNKKFEINGVDITRFKNGKVEEHWGYAEEGKMLTQLGLIRPLIKEGRKEQRDAARRKEVKEFPATSEAK